LLQRLSSDVNSKGITAVHPLSAPQKILTPMTNCCMPILAIMEVPEGAKTEMPV
jgi:hypothetical protein